MKTRSRELLGRFKKSKDGKILASNFGYLMLLQIAGYVFPLITIPYLARVIGVDGFGKIAFAAAIVAWLQTICDWGFTYTATRDVARNRNDLERVSEIYSNVFWARTSLALLSFIALCLLILIIPYFNENKTILFVTFLIVPAHILFPDWFFQAMERMKYITILNLSSKAFFTLLVFILIKSKEDYILQPALMASGFFVAGFGALYLIHAKWGVVLKKPKITEVLGTLKNSFDVFLNSLMPRFYKSFSVILLGFFGGSFANGLLDAGSKFVSISQQLLDVVSRVFFPALSRKIEMHNIYAYGSLVLSVIACFFLYILSPFIINVFYTPEFVDAIVVLKILSFSLFFITLSRVYGTNLLILIGKEKLLRNITLVSSLIGFFTALPMVYYFSYIGAALNIAITRAILGTSVAYFAKKESKK